MQLEPRNFLGGVTFHGFDPGGSYYTFSIYSTYAHEMHIIRTHLFHWSRWWCQKWNWTPLSDKNECFNLGSNFNMRSYDSYPCNIPINRTHFLSWVRSWYFLCNLTPWWGRITHYNIFGFKHVIRPHHGVKLQRKGHQHTQERKCFCMMGIL